jgi:hypothetical protein
MGDRSPGYFPLESLESFRVDGVDSRVYRRPVDRAWAEVDPDSLRSVLADLGGRPETGEEPVRVLIQGLTFDHLDLQGMTLGAKLALDGCSVDGAVRLDFASLLEVAFVDSTAMNFSMRGAQVSGDVDLHGTMVPNLDLRDVVVGGRLVLSGVNVGQHLSEAAAQSHAGQIAGRREAQTGLAAHVALDRARVMQVALLDGLKADQVSAASTQLSGGVVLTGAKIALGDATVLLDSVNRPGGQGSEAEKPFNWELLSQLVGLGAGLTAWVAVVGGARLWARLFNADVPILPTLVGVGRDWMVVEGLKTLAFPVLLGAGVSLFVYYSYRPMDAAERAMATAPEVSSSVAQGANAGDAWTARAGRRLRQWSTLSGLGARAEALPGLIFAMVAIGGFITWSVIAFTTANNWVKWIYWAALAIALISGAGAMWVARNGKAATIRFRLALASVAVASVLLVILWLEVLTVWSMLAMLAVTVGVILLTLGAVDGKSVRGVAFTLFVVITAWSGILGILQEAGAKHRVRTWAFVTLEDGSHVTGEYLGNSGDQLFLATPITKGPQGDVSPVTLESGSVLVVDSKNVDELIYGQFTNLVLKAATDVTVKGDNQRSALEEMCAVAPWLVPEIWCEKGGSQAGGTGTNGASQPVPPQKPAKVIPAPPLAVVQMTLGLQQIQLEVTSLKRRGQFLELDLSLNNRDDGSWTIGSTLSRDGTSTASGIEAFDPPEKTAYLVASKVGQCACPVKLDMATLKPGEWRHLTVTLTAPPSTAKKVDLEIPNFGWVRDVPIS